MNCRWNGMRFVCPSAYSFCPKHWNLKAGEVYQTQFSDKPFWHSKSYPRFKKGNVG